MKITDKNKLFLCKKIDVGPIFWLKIKKEKTKLLNIFIVDFDLLYIARGILSVHNLVQLACSN